MNLKTQILGIVGAAAMTLAIASPAFAQDATNVTVTGGELTITNPLAADFAGAAITGAAQTTTAALAAFSVSDLRGTGDGWHVTAQATQFSTGGVTPITLAANSLTMSEPTVAANGTTSPNPTVNAGPYTIDGAAVSVASAAVDTGMGTYDFSATTLTLSLPANVKAGTYSSTVTVSAVTAP